MECKAWSSWTTTLTNQYCTYLTRQANFQDFQEMTGLNQKSTKIWLGMNSTDSITQKYSDQLLKTFTTPIMASSQDTTELELMMKISQEVFLNGLRKIWKSMDNWMIFILEFEKVWLIIKEAEHDIFELICVSAGYLLAKWISASCRYIFWLKRFVFKNNL